MFDAILADIIEVLFCVLINSCSQSTIYVLSVMLPYSHINIKCSKLKTRKQFYVIFSTWCTLAHNINLLDQMFHITKYRVGSKYVGIFTYIPHDMHTDNFGHSHFIHAFTSLMSATYIYIILPVLFPLNKPFYGIH